MANLETKAKGAVTNKALSDLSAEFDNSQSPLTLSTTVIEQVEITWPTMYVWLQPDKDIYLNWNIADEYGGTALIDNDCTAATAFTAAAGAAVAASTDYYRSSAKSIKISGGTNTTAVYDGITTVIGEKYRAVSYFHRADGNNSITMRKADDSAINVTNVVSGTSLPANQITKAGNWMMLSVDFTATATTTYIGWWGATLGTGTYYIDDVTCYRSSNVLETRDMWIPGGGGPISLRVPWGLSGDPTRVPLKLNILRKVASTTNVKFILG